MLLRVPIDLRGWGWLKRKTFGPLYRLRATVDRCQQSLSSRLRAIDSYYDSDLDNYFLLREEHMLTLFSSNYN